jgi:EAL domain-containing protein (putative c-di-GMP-specific phosphodiesterase class I)/CheY-like chemotaxis protein
MRTLPIRPVKNRKNGRRQKGRTMTSKQRILVVDDESDVGEFVSAAAQAMGFDCTATTDATAFLNKLTPDTTLILLDLMMPEMDGIELLRLLARQKCKAGIILMSGVGKRTLESAGQLAQVLGLSIVGHLQKPFRLAELEEVLARIAEPAKLTIVQPGAPFITQNEELRSAVERNEFVLHYQPLIDIATGRVTGVEALVRWQHPERGLIFPDDFIGRMEKLGLIDQLGWIVVNRGMSDVGQFTNGDGKAFMLSLNASVYSLHDLKFPDTLVSIAEKHGVSPANLTIEITESGLINELSRTLDILTRLRMKQVKLSIDDFGTGYAMMQQLKNIPATELKIDRSFVQGMQSNERDRIMVQKTIEIGHELGMQVIGEGVETQEQLDFLRFKGCDSAQGYLFSRPLPVKETVRWLETYRSTPVH